MTETDLQDHASVAASNENRAAVVARALHRELIAKARAVTRDWDEMASRLRDPDAGRVPDSAVRVWVGPAPMTGDWPTLWVAIAPAWRSMIVYIPPEYAGYRVVERPWHGAAA